MSNHDVILSYCGHDYVTLAVYDISCYTISCFVSKPLTLSAQWSRYVTNIWTAWLSYWKNAHTAAAATLVCGCKLKLENPQKIMFRSPHCGFPWISQACLMTHCGVIMLGPFWVFPTPKTGLQHQSPCFQILGHVCWHCQSFKIISMPKRR